MALRHLAGIAAFAAGLRSVRADDRPLDALMGDVDQGGFGQGFDQASRTVHMPKATIPMLSPGTAEATRRAVEIYDGIVARGGWPEVSKVLELRLGTNHSSVGELRARLTVSGDLDPHASGVENDIYDSYLEEAVRRFQARHGLTVDGVVHEATFEAMNVPAATRRDQLKVNIERLKTLTGNLGPRYVVCNIPAARIEAIEHDVAVSRHTGVVGKPDRPSP
jgi:murein L,D-transpeptidase YcbB/YkuD